MIRKNKDKSKKTKNGEPDDTQKKKGKKKKRPVEEEQSEETSPETERATRGKANPLSGLKKAWKKAPAIAGLSTWPDGDYAVRIDSITIGKSKGESKRMQCVWGLVGVTESVEGKKLSKFDGLDSEEGIGYFKGTLENLGVDIPDNITKLPKILEALIGTGATITVRTKDEYTNIYINDVFDLSELDDAKESDSDDDDDDDDNDDNAEDDADDDSDEDSDEDSDDDDDDEDEDEFDDDDFEDDDEDEDKKG